MKESLLNFNGTSNKKKFLAAIAFLILLVAASAQLMAYFRSTARPSCELTGSNLSDACILRLNQTRIAVVKSVFAATPYYYYRYDSFYSFYHWADQSGVSSCTTEKLDRLRTNVIDTWGRWGTGLKEFVDSSIAKGYFNSRTTQVLTDIQVDDGALLSSSSGQKNFDVVIIGFSEYVTAREFSNYKHFVATGGKLIILSASSFIAEVAYDKNTNTERLVMGHGWSFDGIRACRGPYARWYSNNTNWVGGNKCCFYTSGYMIHGAVANTSNPESAALRAAFGNKTILTSYSPHEEGSMTNSTGSSTIAYWNVTNAPGNTGPMIRIFVHSYKLGSVVYTGISGNDIIGNDVQLQFLVYSSILTNPPSSAGPDSS